MSTPTNYASSGPALRAGAVIPKGAVVAINNTGAAVVYAAATTGGPVGISLLAAGVGDLVEVANTGEVAVLVDDGAPSPRGSWVYLVGDDVTVSDDVEDLDGVIKIGQTVSAAAADGALVATKLDIGVAGVIGGE